MTTRYLAQKNPIINRLYSRYIPPIFNLYLIKKFLIEKLKTKTKNCGLLFFLALLLTLQY